MTELRDELRRAGRAVAPPDQALDEMLRRGERRRRASRAGTAAFALGLTVAVLGGALFGLTQLGRGGTARPSDGGLVMADGEYHYLKVRSVGPGATYDGGQAVMDAYDAELDTWWGHDDSGRIEKVREDGGYGLPDEGEFGPDEFPEMFGITDVTDLSTDPTTLRNQLIARHRPASTVPGASPQPDVTPEPGQDAETGKLIRDIRDMITWPNVLPELRQALFEVAAALPTMERRDRATDPVGRDAIELSIVSESTTYFMYFDPATRLWMGTRYEYADGHDSPSYQLVLAEGFTGSTDRPPADDALFFPGPQREIQEP